MSPAEHYREAERLLEKAEQARQDKVTKALVDQAQVHALLAAATDAHSARPGRWEEE